MRLPRSARSLMLLLLTGCAAPPPGDASHDPADPDAVGPIPEAVPATVPAVPATTVAAVYVCPMHNDMTCDGPGKCPKCGMALARKDGPR